MVSLALMVSAIFLAVILSGPCSLLAYYFNMPLTASIFAAVSVAVGAYWCCVAPFPVSAIGALSALCGAITFTKL